MPWSGFCSRLALFSLLAATGLIPAAQAHSTWNTTNAPAARSDWGKQNKWNQHPGHQRDRAAHHRTKTKWLRIIAFTDGPVAGADVLISAQDSHGRSLPDIRAVTNSQGVFPAAVPQNASSFRVYISGGTVNGNPFFGHLMADVEPARLRSFPDVRQKCALTHGRLRGRNAIAVCEAALRRALRRARRSPIVAVNPVTTMVSLMRDARPNLKLGEAEALVRSFLGLPANYSLGLALRQSPGYHSRLFSPVAFLKAAQAVGGLDNFENVLLQKLLASSARCRYRTGPCAKATHTFRGQQLLGDSAAEFIAEGLAEGVLAAPGDEGVGWLMSQAGLVEEDETQEELEAILSALVDLQSEIEDLSNQVAQLTQLVQTTATQTQYNTIVVPAQALADQVNGVEGDLSYFANACPPLPEGGTPAPPDAFCTNQKASINAELNDLTIQQSYVTLEGYIADNATIGFSGMLHLYSLWLGESKPFFRAADSTKMQNLYNYWDTALTQAANLKVELLHQNGAQNNTGGQQQLTDFMGNPNLNPPTTGTFQANQTANQTLILSPVPDGTVVPTDDPGTMWSLIPWVYNGRGRNSNGVPVIIVYPILFDPPECSVYPEEGPLATWQQGYAGFSDWGEIPPSKDAWQNLVKAAPQSGTSWQSWLIQETETTSEDTDAGATPSPGFFDLSSCGYGAWTSSSEGGGQYYLIDLTHNSFPALSGLNFNEFIWPTRKLASGERYFWTK